MIKWDQSRVNGITRKKENPVSRAKIEIFEKVGIIKDEITPVKSTEKIKIYAKLNNVLSSLDTIS